MYKQLFLVGVDEVLFLFQSRSNKNLMLKLGKKKEETLILKAANFYIITSFDVLYLWS